MVGSSQSTAGPTFVLNTIVADVLSEIADELESASDSAAAAQGVLQKIAKEHSRILFNGDNYTDSWVTEAKKRGLANIRSTVDSLATLTEPESIEVLSKHNVLTETELRARAEILLENYSKVINIEAMTMLNMAKRQILPTAASYSARLGSAVAVVKEAGVAADTQKAMLEKVCSFMSLLHDGISALEAAVDKAGGTEEGLKNAEAYRDLVVPAMNKVREPADELEKIVDADLWPLPTYAEMLFCK